MTCVACDPCVDGRPALGLEEFRRILKYNPYYFWQMGQNPADVRGTRIPYEGSVPCEQVVFERGDMGGGGAAGRQDVWDAVYDVTRRFADYVHYFPVPMYSSQEVAFKQPWSGVGRVQLKHKKIKALGIERLEKVATVPLDAATQLLDVNGDGLYDTFRVQGVPFTGTINEGDELLLFRPYDETESILTGASEEETRWRREIRPAHVTVRSDGLLDVTFRSWLGVDPLLYTGVNACVLDPQKVENYITAVEVWRRYTDTSVMVTMWRRANSGCGCPSASVAALTGTAECYECEEGTACLVNGDLGLIELNLSREMGCCQRCLDKICVHTLSGECDDLNLLARAVAGELGRDLCCGKQHSELAYWQNQYVGQTSEGKFTSAVSRSERRSGLGTSRGALALYEFLRPRRVMTVFRI